MKTKTIKRKIKKPLIRINPMSDGSAIYNLLTTLRAAKDKSSKYSTHYLAVLELVEQDLKDGDLITYNSSVVKTINYLDKYKHVFDHLLEDMRHELE